MRLRLTFLQPSQSDYRSESAATAAAAVLAANAAAAAAAAEAHRKSAALGITLGKRKRKPRQDADYVDPASEEEDEELKGAGECFLAGYF